MPVNKDFIQKYTPFMVMLLLLMLIVGLIFLNSCQTESKVSEYLSKHPEIAQKYCEPVEPKLIQGSIITTHDTIQQADTSWQRGYFQLLINGATCEQRNDSLLKALQAKKERIIYTNSVRVDTLIQPDINAVNTASKTGFNQGFQEGRKSVVCVNKTPSWAWWILSILIALVLGIIGRWIYNMRKG